MRNRREPPSRLSRLRRVLRKEGLESLLVTFLPNVRYLTGFTGSAGAVMVEGRTATLVTDFRYRIQAAREVKGFRLVEQKDSLTETLVGIVKKRGLWQVGFESRHLSVAMHRQLGRRLRGVRLLPREGLVENLRAVKDRGEIAMIRAAIRSAGQSYRSATRRLTGRREVEVAHALEEGMRKSGADAAAFPSIVAAGPSGALPHAAPRGRTIRSGELVVIDFGARWKGYHSDVTRTRLSGRTRARQRQIYRIVEEAQRRAIASVRPGVEARAVDEAARTVIDEAGYGDAFGHGTGHGVGLEVHEKPSIAPKSGEILSPGMVFTVEPGIYVKNFGGVRIEDMVLVTASGCEVLTRSIPRPAL